MTAPLHPVALHPVALHGAPRSGTTWLGEIFNSHPQVRYAFQPMFSYAFKEFLGPDPDAARIAAFWEALAQSDDAFIRQAEKRADGRLPDFGTSAPTHLVYKEVRHHHLLPVLMARAPTLRAVLIVRDPRAVISSWLRAPREFRADLGWRVEEEWRAAPSKNLGRAEEFNGFDRWKDATRIFLDLAAAHPQRVALIRYADLLADPDAGVAGLFDLCGLEVTDRTTAFLHAGTRADPSDPYGVDARRRADTGWRDRLDPGIAEEIAADLAGTPLAAFLD
ncbi:sulfotransferase [Roseobacter sp. HKCCA0434]|uniref:sulfotransferase family protein n=1 Tax=Roseobacter sp. HKCCA0434 TaxID=3079297 RepID=UPI002905C8AB|nr:sulfotransferase [Roseobacter sp. HKCCA0434]